MQSMIRAALIVWLVVARVNAAEIAVVSHKELSSVNQLATGLADAMALDVDIRLVHEDLTDAPYKAVILVGSKALASWRGKQPAVAVFVSRNAVESHRQKLSSAVYIEPPLSRQLSLAAAILGNDKPLGVLTSGVGNLPDDVAHLAKDSNVTFYPVAKYESLNRALVDLLRNNQALVGIYDSQLYSSANIKNILITAYRQNKPLIGPSSAYIKAGALATTFSDIDDVVTRLKVILRQGFEGNWLKPAYNPYFKIRYNEQVGRSLNLQLPPETALRNKMMRQEGS